MNDFNFDENTINKVKNMMNNGELSDVMSKISPEMIQNFSTVLNSNGNATGNTNANNSGKSGFDFNNIDMNTVMKMKSIMEKMNDKNDPRSNLLNSLRPYLREEKRGKLDQYANLMNVAKIADALKDEGKGSNS